MKSKEIDWEFDDEEMEPTIIGFHFYHIFDDNDCHVFSARVIKINIGPVCSVDLLFGNKVFYKFPIDGYKFYKDNRSEDDPYFGDIKTCNTVIDR